MSSAVQIMKAKLLRSAAAHCGKPPAFRHVVFMRFAARLSLAARCKASCRSGKPDHTVAAAKPIALESIYLGEIMNGSSFQ